MNVITFIIEKNDSYFSGQLHIRATRHPAQGAAAEASDDASGQASAQASRGERHRVSAIRLQMDEQSAHEGDSAQSHHSVMGYLFGLCFPSYFIFEFKRAFQSELGRN